MATVTITIKDLDLMSEDFDVNFSATGDEIDHGQATAAYFTGYYLYGLVNTPEFTDEVADFGRTLVQLMKDQGYDNKPTSKATVKLTLTDDDLNRGTYKPTLEIRSAESHGERLPTVAEVVGAHMRNLLNKPEFVAAVWDYAAEHTRDRDDRVIANLDQAPEKAA